MVDVLLTHLCVTAERLHSPVRSPLGHGLDCSMVELGFGYLVTVSSQERLLSSGPLNFHHYILKGVCFWRWRGRDREEID